MDGTVAFARREVCPDSMSIMSVIMMMMMMIIKVYGSKGIEVILDIFPLLRLFLFWRLILL